MLKKGADFLGSLSDGRRIMLGTEEVRDPGHHPAFEGTARMIADLYDERADYGNEGSLWVEEEGERTSVFYLIPKTKEDLWRRSQAHKWLADRTMGLLGRSFDHVASFVTGIAMAPGVLAGQDPPTLADNLTSYFHYARHHDLYLAYAVLPPQGARSVDTHRTGDQRPGLRILDERDDGIVISGVKTLASGAVFADAIWLGNLQPLTPDQADEAVTCAVPACAPGLTLWSRRPLFADQDNLLDKPLARIFDETDCVVVCNEVKVPWENVFVMRNTHVSHDMYVRTPSHCLSNHQSNVRFWAKLQFLTGLAWRLTTSSGIQDVPAVRDQLGRLAAMEALAASAVAGQIENYETVEGGVCYNRRGVYALLNWGVESYPNVIGIIRDLSGGAVVQLPASRDVLDQPVLRSIFDQYWNSANCNSEERYDLVRLAWEFIGSEFAGRQNHYERFFAGSPYVVRSHSFREAEWEVFARPVNELLNALRSRG